MREKGAVGCGTCGRFADSPVLDECRACVMGDRWVTKQPEEVKSSELKEGKMIPHSERDCNNCRYCDTDLEKEPCDSCHWGSGWAGCCEDDGVEPAHWVLGLPPLTKRAVYWVVFSSGPAIHVKTLFQTDGHGEAGMENDWIVIEMDDRYFSDLSMGERVAWAKSVDMHYWTEPVKIPPTPDFFN